MDAKPEFFVGQLVTHRLFHYRGVIVDVDPHFMHSEEWYEAVAQSRPPKDKPWYRVLVHDAGHETYVAERNLAPDGSDEPIEHPELQHYFHEFGEGRYVPKRKAN